ncbi:MAG: hypothetical protein BYD32DRAFT_404778 [Podila humilis]|nr:MAG: hypothetical protein BYD32DRAFT_404778 [Podila humilis]
MPMCFNSYAPCIFFCVVDVRAAFMDRTQTKDTIQRLSTRLFYAGIHRQASRQTTLNFEVPGSSK